MAVLKDTRTLRDAPNGAAVRLVPGGTRVTVGPVQGAWIEITLVDLPGPPRGWVSVAAVDQTTDTLGPLDKQVFALECHCRPRSSASARTIWPLIAALRTNMTDGPGQGGAVGPYAFTAAEWALNATQPQFQLAAPATSINSWTLQIAVFAIMMRLAQQRLAALLGSQPTATELYFSQLIGSKAAVTALQDRTLPMASILAAIDPASAAADGIDVANLGARDAALLGAGTVADALRAISEALKAALELTKAVALAAGDQLLAQTGAALQASGTVSSSISSSPRIPAGRRDMAELIATRFAEAGYGVLQQIAAIANAIGDWFIPTIKAAGAEQVPTACSSSTATAGSAPGTASSS